MKMLPTSDKPGDFLHPGALEKAEVAMAPGLCMLGLRV